MSSLDGTALIDIHTDRLGSEVDPNVYAHFIEHLATCIYDGIWVGPGSCIPNEDGLRLDTLQALARLHPPLFRWPGGYFADLYDWQDGIGPREARPTRVCPTQINREETNAFGTAEFIRFCQALGAEPYLCVNTAFMTGNDAGSWVEYCNLDGNTAWAAKRREHGYQQPFGVKYWGIGNESYWRHSAPDYLQRYRECKHYMCNADPSIAVISSGLEPNWRPEPWGREDWGTYLIRETRADMDMYSIHTYFNCGHADEFSDQQYYELFVKLWRRLPRSIQATAGLLDAHSAFPRETKIAIDEWGIWHPGWPMGPDMRQPSTLRDALFAAAFFHICHDHSSRVAMATIAQTVNVAHALVITEGERLFLTPTYHVFDMLQNHMAGRVAQVAVSGVSRLGRQDAGLEDEPAGPVAEPGTPSWTKLVPTAPEEKMMPPLLWVSATVDESGSCLTCSAINLSLSQSIPAQLRLHGTARPGAVSAKMLSSGDVRDQNSFDNPQHVVPVDMHLPPSETEGLIDYTFPPHSLTVFSIEL